MSATTEVSASTTAIRPFTVPVIPEAELQTLRVRITATRWPAPELVADFSQGVQEPLAQALTDPTAGYGGADEDEAADVVRPGGLTRHPGGRSRELS